MEQSVYDARIHRIQQALRHDGFDALVATKPQTFFYLSDFNPIIFSHPTIVVLPIDRPPTLLVWAVRDDHARSEAMAKDIRLFGRWSEKPYLALDPYEALQKLLGELALTQKVLGIEEDHLSAKVLGQLHTLLPKATLRDASSIVDHARYVKDREEIARMRRAGKLADAGMNAAVEGIRERRTEIEIAMSAEIAMRMLLMKEYPDQESAGFAGNEGAIWSGLWCWVPSGPRLAINADTPKRRRVQDGDLVLPQIWAIADGYTAENERTVGVGNIPAHERRAFDAIIGAREAAFKAVHPGATCADVYEAAAAEMRRTGYEKHLPGRIGHSIGLGPHEHLSLGPEDHVKLEEGMAITIEPGILGSVRHSDTIAVTATGYELLTNTPNGVLLV